MHCFCVCVLFLMALRAIELVDYSTSIEFHARCSTPDVIELMADALSVEAPRDSALYAAVRAVIDPRLITCALYKMIRKPGSLPMSDLGCKARRAYVDCKGIFDPYERSQACFDLADYMCQTRSYERVEELCEAIVAPFRMEQPPEAAP